MKVKICILFSDSWSGHPLIISFWSRRPSRECVNIAIYCCINTQKTARLISYPPIRSINNWNQLGSIKSLRHGNLDAFYSRPKTSVKRKTLKLHYDLQKNIDKLCLSFFSSKSIFMSSLPADTSLS